MLSFINAFNLSLFILFTVLYSYQIFYAFVALFHKVRPTPPASRNHRYAVLIAARNESDLRLIPEALGERQLDVGRQRTLGKIV